jgi:hypothetical protein
VYRPVLPPRLAWAVGVVCVTLAILSLVFGAWNYDSLGALLTGVGWNAILAVSFPVVGALIASHRPRNPMGWIFLAVGLSEGLVGLAWEYGVYGLQTAPGTVPGAGLATWCCPPLGVSM